MAGRIAGSHDGRRAAQTALLLAAALFAHAGMAEDWPALKKGRWEMTRTSQAGPAPAETTSYKECSNPTVDMMRNAYNDFAKRCETSPLTRNGNTYRYSTLCATPSGKMLSRYTFTVDGDSAFKLEIEAEQGGLKVKGVTTARYIGKC